MTRNRIPGIWLGVFLYALLIFGLSAVPAPYVPLEISRLDKLFHFILYFPFGLLVLKALRASFDSGKLYSLLIAIFVISIYALSDEFHQTFVPGRQFSLIDMSFDVEGALTGCLLIYGQNRSFSKRSL